MNRVTLRRFLDNTSTFWVESLPPDRPDCPGCWERVLTKSAVTEREMVDALWDLIDVDYLHVMLCAFRSGGFREITLTVEGEILKPGALEG